MQSNSNTPAYTCAGCGEPVESSVAAQVTVEAAKHVITVYAHEGHQEAARANTMQRTDWKRNPSFYAG